MKISMRFAVTVMAAVLALSTTAPVADSVTDESTRGGSLAMVERLRAIAESPEFLTRYNNDQQLAALLGKRDAEPEAFASDLAARASVALQALRAGESELAVRELRAALELHKSAPPPAGDTAAVLEERRRRSARQRLLTELLALAYLRLGEQRNCLENHSADSCLLPIKDGGLHKDPRGSKAAIGIYRALLRSFPNDLGYRWLYNLAWMTVGGYPDQVEEAYRIDPSVYGSESGFPRFRDVSMGAGVGVRELSGGAAMDDFDGDGDLDVLASSWGPTDPLRLFANRGDGSFEEVTASAGLEGLNGGLNLVPADYDNDGDLDVFVLRGAWLGKRGKQPNSLLRNDGKGRFVDVTERAGVLSLHPTQTAAWADFDGDGQLDLFVGNESRPDGHPCELFRNNGDGTFTDIAPAVGLDHLGFVKASSWGDFDNDGRPDLFLSRMGQPNVLFHNAGEVEGTWRFVDVTEKAGVAGPIKSFPTWWFDYDNDGWLDLVVGSFADFGGSALKSVVSDLLDVPTDAARARLYRNDGDGTFTDVSKATGFDRVLLAMGANFGDIDNDGWLDAYFGTGEPEMRTLVPNVMLRNDAGRGFVDVTAAGGFGNLQKGHGIAFGDYDGDGDQDIYAVLGGAYSGDVYPNALLRNPGNDNAWITLQLIGKSTGKQPSNRQALGARVQVELTAPDGKSRTLHRVVTTGGSFGASSHQLEIGLGPAPKLGSIVIDWPSGRTTRHEGLPLRHHVTLHEDGSEPLTRAPAKHVKGTEPMHGREHSH